MSATRLLGLSPASLPGHDRDRIGKAIANGEQPAGVVTDVLIPPGLGPRGFLQRMRHVEHPSVAPPPMPATWIHALSRMVKHWDGLSAWRHQQMQTMRDAAQKLQHLRGSWANTLHPDVKHVIGHLHLPFLDWLRAHVDYPCQDYVHRLMRGKPCLGEILPSGVFKAERNEVNISLQAWTSCPRERNLKMVTLVRSSGDSQLDLKAWEKLEKELARHCCEGPSELAGQSLSHTTLP